MRDSVFELVGMLLVFGFMIFLFVCLMTFGPLGLVPWLLSVVVVVGGSIGLVAIGGLLYSLVIMFRR